MPIFKVATSGSYTHPNHSGEVTSVADGVQTIAAGVVTLAKMADIATSSLIYRKTALAGVPEVNTLATLKTDLSLVKADVGLGSVDNTADTAKPVSTAQQTALDAKQPLDADLTAIAGLAGVEGDIIYKNGTQWQRLPKGTASQQLRINAGATAPEWFTPAGASYTLVATLASDQATAANKTPVTLTDLVFTYAVNSVYRIWFMGRVSPTAATTGCGFQFDLSSTVIDINVEFFHQLASTGTLSGGHSIADDASVGVSSGMPVAAGTYPVYGVGILRTNANTGTAQLRFRSETTAVTTCKAGMTLVVEKIV